MGEPCPEEAHGDISRAVKRRIVLAQTLYAIGALVGLVNVTLGIGSFC